MNMPVVVLTVPHGFPSELDDSNVHFGDYIAAAVAYKLAVKLAKKEIICYLFINPLNRDGIDMNRPESRGSDFRQSILDCLVKNPNCLHLDIHSYPIEDEKWNNYDVVLLESWGYSSLDLINRIKSRLKKMGFKVGIKESSAMNDIIISSSMLGNNAVLVECCECFKGREEIISNALAKVVELLIL